ncbi:WD40 repeat-like protein [Laetiporus sulphureus 93-53]|uniref:WD40 repeat-like protein n=1 Tax=Laetiporus sulphureus 93-53 TaxID=1314785 RepID=A0A165FP85_9APHY|nr:WD40 repeat-like protein [Laetiporus sulphureus 93-53]KZT09268.1 WD40 repeat-like protein [Laetiporus sulphureus 93-53]
MKVDPILLPIAAVQPDFTSSLSEVRDGLVPEETFWLSCYKHEEPSIHGKVHATLDDVDRDLVRLEGRDGVEMISRRGDTYFASCPSLHLPPTRLAIPAKVYVDPAAEQGRRPRKITAFDVSPDGTQFATGYYDGSVCIRQTSGFAEPTTCKPHLSTVSSVQFFPSSKVLLTAGSDFSLSILPADKPDASSIPRPSFSPVRVLRGHSRGVTSIAIIARGRNVLSGSKDGTVRLWDVPSGAQIRTLVAGGHSYVPVLALSLGKGVLGSQQDGTDEKGRAPDDIDPREVETADKLAFCGLQDGTFEVFDLRTKHSVFRSTADTETQSPLHAISYTSVHGMLATGSSTGIVSLYDIRTLESPLTAFRRNTAAIEDLQFLSLDAKAFALPQAVSQSGATSNMPEASDVGLAIAAEDGLPYVADVRPGGPNVRAELVGPDCDPVRAVRVVREEDVWVAADDGVVRRYRMR